MKKLLLAICFLSLVGISAVAYATCKDGNGFECYPKDDYSKSPKGDCLEMKCEHGCVENAKGDGHCCAAPRPGSDCRGTYKDGCLYAIRKCPLGQFCNDKGRCIAGCSSSAECPDLHTYCLDHKCVPCNAEGTGIRPSLEAEYCECPEGYAKRCGSTSTSTSCVDGGTWTCVKGCYDNTDCPTDEYCSCNGKDCPVGGGKCIPCPEGTHRAATSATNCVPCAECEEWDASAQACVSQCGPGQLCLQNCGTGEPADYNKCGGDMCLGVPEKDALIYKEGMINGRGLYFPPAQDQYKMTHTSASRFCEHYGMHLATVNEACVKDYAYDTGHDCPNFVSIKTFTDRGLTYNLGSWDVESLGSFWLADVSGTDALRVTYSCGNNHSSNVCNRFYPLCTTD